MEHPLFYEKGSLFEVVETFYKYGLRYIFIDEVHKYAHWSRELKVIYDGFPDLKIVFSASSALEIFQGEADLSRRVSVYEFPGLSFREYLNFIYGHEFPAVGFEDILKNHRELTENICKGFHPLPLFRQYLRTGYLPMIKEISDQQYQVSLIQIINAVLIQDLQLAKRLTAGNVNKLKALLGVISESAPFEPNISNIAQKVSINRETVYTFLTYLEQARLLNFIPQKKRGIAALQKPSKIFLENTNYSFAIQIHPETGTIRETFLLNQLKNAGHKVHVPDSKYDFLVDGYHVIEVGGKSKKVKDTSVFTAKDDIEIGFGNTIPLWLFGFLY